MRYPDSKGNSLGMSGYPNKSATCFPLLGRRKMWGPIPQSGLAACMAVPEEMGVRHTVRQAPKALLVQRRDCKLSSPAHYLPTSDRRLSSAARQSSHKCWSSWSQRWLVRGISQLWITVEAKKLAACTSGTNQCLSELSRCCHKPQNLVLWWKVLCTAVSAVCSKDSVLQQRENPG